MTILLDELLRLEEYDSEEMDIIYGIRAIKGCENISGEECLQIWGDMERLVNKIEKG